VWPTAVSTPPGIALTDRVPGTQRNGGTNETNDAALAHPSARASSDVGVWKLPREVVARAAFRVVAHATTGQWSNQVVPELTALEASNR